VLIVGSVCNAIGTLSFAFVTNYPMAVIVRLFTGFTNANAVASRSLLADFTDKTNRTQAFTYLNVFSILGSIVGPFLGGMLAEPQKRFPGVFAGVSFFEDFPFSLPCFTTLILSLLGLYLAIFYVYDEPPKSSQAHSPLLPSTPTSYSFCESLRLLKGNSAYLTVVFAWCVTGLVLAMTTELTALWGKSAVDHGGLGWEEEYKIGLLFAWGSLVLLLFLIVFLRKLIDRCGCPKVLQMFQLIATPTVLGLPACHLLYGTWLLWPGLMAVTGLWGICMGVMLTAVQLGINAVVQPELVGSANGLALSIVALVRSLGPLTAGAIFGWSLNTGLGFPFNYYFAYFLEAILLFLSFLVVHCSFKISAK